MKLGTMSPKNMMTNDVLGYTLREGNLEPIIQPEGYIYTQAFILCTNCNRPISSHGGPRFGSYCLECVKELLNEPQTGNH